MTKTLLTLPDSHLLRQLIIRDNGFVFDPTSGHSFTVNETGVALLREMLQHCHVTSIVEALTAKWDVDPGQAKQDILAFANELQTLLHGPQQ